MGMFMAWKQDLAKLKQQLDPESSGPTRKVTPKPATKPSGPAVLDDEDAVFLSAMGLKSTQPSRTPKAAASDVAISTPIAPESLVPETFQEAIRDLKGLKPLAKDRLDQGPPPTSSAHHLPKTEPVAIQTQSSEAVFPELACPIAPSPPQPSLPMRFQLAAGMALDVDGILDLRGHSLPDAMERLKDRLGDGVVLGWRSLQVTLGPDPTLHEGLLELLTSGQMPMVVRYAQAPVPMGGTQAWLLYFGPSLVQP
jgi:hypothetical protein